jgi:predicted alpha/beta superfamily hydrolase
MSAAVYGDVEVVNLSSRHTGVDYRVFVARPTECSETVRPVVALDAAVSFGTLVEITRLLRMTEDLPPLLVVGVGYPERRLGDALGPRQRDLTFSRTEDGGWPDDPEMMGEASAFREFLREELKPRVTESYAVTGEDWGILGSSLGGLFVTHLLLETPELFQRYGIGSPSYWWDRGAIWGVSMPPGLGEGHVLRVAITVGEYEQADGRRRYIAQLAESRRAAALAEDEEYPEVDMVADAQRMYRQLRGVDGVQATFDVIPGEYHQTVVPAHLSRVVRRLYDGPV